MKWSIKEVASVLLVVAVLAVGTLSGASEVWAAGEGCWFGKQIGKLGSRLMYNEQDGKKTEQFGLIREAPCF